MSSRLSILLFLAVLALAAAPFVGIVAISPVTIWSASSASPEGTIFWSVRLPRVLLGFLAGGLLAASGLVVQAVFRNPLASPFTLGISSGAAFGAALSFFFGLSIASLPLAPDALFALIGAFGSAALIAVLARTGRIDAATGLIVAGLVANFFFSSAVVLLQYLSEPAGVFRMVRWLMGGIDGRGYDAVWRTLILGAPPLLLLYKMSRRLDVFALGDELSLARGVDPHRFRTGVFLLLSFLVGGVVSICGPIGFVDIVVPQVARKFFGFSHRALLPAVFLLGGISLLVCDTIARIAIAPAELPAGIVTALIGGPFFLWALLSTKPNN